MTALHRAEPLGNRASGDGEISRALHTHPLILMLELDTPGNRLRAIAGCPACDPTGYRPTHRALAKATTRRPLTDVGGPRVPPGT